MDCDQAAEDRLDAGGFETSFADHRAENLHLGKPADRFHEIAIAVFILGDRLADPRNDMFRIAIVDFAEAGPFAGRKLQAIETSAAFQDTMGFPKCAGNVGDVPDTECNRLGVERAIGKAELFSVFDLPGETRDPA